MKLTQLLLLATLAASTLNTQPANKPIRVAIASAKTGCTIELKSLHQ